MYEAIDDSKGCTSFYFLISLAWRYAISRSQSVQVFIGLPGNSYLQILKLLQWALTQLITARLMQLNLWKNSMNVFKTSKRDIFEHGIFHFSLTFIFLCIIFLLGMRQSDTQYLIGPIRYQTNRTAPNSILVYQFIPDNTDGTTES